MSAAAPAVIPFGQNDTLLWGMTSAERLRRIAAAQGLNFAQSAELPVMMVDLEDAVEPG